MLDAKLFANVACTSQISHSLAIITTVLSVSARRSQGRVLRTWKSKCGVKGNSDNQGVTHSLTHTKRLIRYMR